MRKELYQTIQIPESVKASIEGNELSLKGSEGEMKKTFDLGRLEFGIKEGKIIIGNKKSTKTEKKMMNTITAHIHNMIKGVQKKFEYKLKICFSHFPITVEIKGNDVTIKNFLGEKIPRKTKIIKGTEVNVDKEFITVKSCDKELAGQTAANFEKATRIRMRDRRIFQDGIYIINKAGREI